MPEDGRLTFTCSMCGGTFVSGRPDEEALAAFKARFPTEDVEDAQVLCDDCYERFSTWFNSR